MCLIATASTQLGFSFEPLRGNDRCMMLSSKSRVCVCIQGRSEGQTRARKAIKNTAAPLKSDGFFGFFYFGLFNFIL